MGSTPSFLTRTMSTEPESFPPACSPPLADPNAVCDECGVFGAFAFESVKLCVNCYVEKGSCCAELGKDDLGMDRVLE